VVGVERDDLVVPVLPLHALRNDTTRSAETALAIEARFLRRRSDSRAVGSTARLASRLDLDDPATYGPAL
jgi:hypothetical protein